MELENILRGLVKLLNIKKEADKSDSSGGQLSDLDKAIKDYVADIAFYLRLGCGLMFIAVGKIIFGW